MSSIIIRFLHQQAWLSRLTLILCLGAVGLGSAHAVQISQTVNFVGVPPSGISVNENYVALGAFTTSGLPVTYSFTTVNGACTLLNSGAGISVLGLSVGTCTIIATSAGDLSFSAAQSAITFPVNGISQTVSFGISPTITTGGAALISATATSALPVTLSSLTPTACSVMNGSVTSLTAGTCTIMAYQSGINTSNGVTTHSYAAAQAYQTFTIGKANQTVSFGTAPVVVIGGTGYASAIATSTLTTSFTSNTPGICTITGNIITGVSAGTCIIAANQTGDTNYNPATQVTQSISVIQSNYGSALNLVNAVNLPGSIWSPGGIALGSGLNYSTQAGYGWSKQYGGMFVTGYSIQGSSTQIYLTQTTPVPVTVTVPAGAIVEVWDIETMTVIATNIASPGSPVVFSAQPNHRYGGFAWYADNSQQNLAIYATSAPPYQSIALASAQTMVVGTSNQLWATSTAGLNVNFSSTTPGICTVNYGVLIGIAAGTCIITADQPGNASYTPAAQVTQSISVVTANYGSALNLVNAGNPFGRIWGPGSNGITLGGGLNFSTQVGVGWSQQYGGIFTTGYSIQGSPTQIYLTQTTPLSVTVTVPAGAIVEVWDIETLTVVASNITNPGSPAVFLAQPNHRYGGFAWHASNAQQSLAIYAAATPAGGPAMVPQIISNQAIGTITVAPLAFGGSTQISANATSGLPVNLSTSTPAICTVNGNIVKALAIGTCVITANQPGDANYNPATQVTQAITVTKATQTVSFGATPVVIVGGTGSLSATSTSALAVSFTSTTPLICTVSGNTVTGISAGTCIIAADQAGNATFNAAQQIMRGVVVTVAPAPVARLSSVSLTFSNQNIGVASATQTVTLSNTGTAVLNITGITTSADFMQTNDCGTAVAAGASCTLTIAATPTVAGIRSGTISIASNATGNPSIISLSATGIAVPPITLNPGWNLIGNGVNTPLTVATTFGNTANVTTVWKWIPATSKWAFYTPSLADGGAAYAITKGYDFLTVINGGEGFWVNAKAAFTAQLPAGTAISSATFSDQLLPPNLLPSGWSLIAIGDNRTPRAFATAIYATNPAVGVVPPSLTTLWAWDSAQLNWYFYAPSLDNSGGLAGYITTKGYLDFASKTLAPTTGFWVNHP